MSNICLIHKVDLTLGPKNKSSNGILRQIISPVTIFAFNERRATEKPMEERNFLSSLEL